MKTWGALLAAACVFFVCLEAKADAPQFAALKSDQASYTIGQKAVLTAYLQITAQDPDYTLYLSATFNGQPIKVYRISDTQQVSITPALSQAGNGKWKVSVYLEDAKRAHDYEATVAYYGKEICSLNSRLAGETDPDKIQLLQSEVTRDQGIIAAAQSELDSIRRLVEMDTLTVQVNAQQVKPKPLIRAQGVAMSLSLDSIYSQYAVESQALLSVHVNTAFDGPDGPGENLVRVNLDSTAQGVNDLGPQDFSSQTAVFAATDVGQHLFSATLLTRPHAQAESLREAIDAAEKRRACWITQLDGTQDPMEQAYDQSQIDDLTQTITAFGTQLDDILISVETDTIGFTVKASR